MQWVYATGGREKYFKAENVGDCVTRAIALATGKDYMEVYKSLKELAKLESIKKHRGGKRSSVRDGVYKETWKKYLEEIGWVKVSTMKKGDPRRVHLTEEECPKDAVCIVQLSKHLVCLKNGIIYDTYNCSEKTYYDMYGELCMNNERVIYSYWIPSNELPQIKVKKEKKNTNSEQIKKIRYEYFLEISKLKRKIANLEKERDQKINELKGEN